MSRGLGYVYKRQVRLNGESRVTLKRVATNDNIQRQVTHLINFLFLYALLSVFLCACVAMLNLCRNSLVLCVGSYAILSRIIVAMQMLFCEKSKFY